MCTAVSFRTLHHYFGRNLDLEGSYGEEITILPRRRPLEFCGLPPQPTHYAMIGTAHVAEGYPLYYDATNEKGLSMAGLNFPVSAAYRPPTPPEPFAAPFELIPWVLGQCGSAKQAEERLREITICNISFGDYPITPLHWLVSDREYAFAVEPMEDGLHLIPDPVGVLTNEPPLPVQMLWLNNFMGVSPERAEDRFAPGVALTAYSRGMGGMGLPGDFSSSSRFVRAAFVSRNARCGTSERESVSQFFHILSAVEQPRGCVHLGDGKYEITRYSSCCNTDRGIYYYRTYEDSRIKAVELSREDLDGKELIRYPMREEEEFWVENG